MLFTALALSNDAQIDKDGNIIGDPTEIALFAIARDYGFNKSELEINLPRVSEIPFDSDRKCMTTFHRVQRYRVHDTGYKSKSCIGHPCIMHTFISFTKGAIEVLIDRAENILTSDGIKALDKEEIHKINERMAADGLRVLGIAIRGWDELPSEMSHENVEKGLTIIGLVGIMDPQGKRQKKLS